MNNTVATAKTLWTLYTKEFSNFKGINREEFSIAAMSILKKMLTEMGAQTSQEVIKYALQNWDLLRKTFTKLPKYPSVSLVYHYRHSFLQHKNTPAKNSVRYEGKVSTTDDEIDTEELFFS